MERCVIFLNKWKCCHFPYKFAHLKYSSEPGSSLVCDEFFLKASMRAHLKVFQYGGYSGWCCNNTRTKARAVKTCKKWFCRLITYHWNYNYIPYLLFTFVKSSYNTTTITICIVVFLVSRKSNLSEQRPLKTLAAIAQVETTRT